MDLVERVENVIRANIQEQWGHVLIGGDAQTARAAIAEVLDAMGEPSEAMIEAGFRARSNDMTMAESANAVWQAMLAQFKAENVK